jgi:hypothetical protein
LFRGDDMGDAAIARVGRALDHTPFLETIHNC